MGDMAVIFRCYDGMDESAQALSRWQLPHQVRKRSGSFNPLEDTIKVLTMHAAGVGVSVGGADGCGADAERDEARLFFFALTRVTREQGNLVILQTGNSYGLD